MINKVFVFDPTASDSQSAVRGIGRYLQILKENFPDDFVFSSHLPPTTYPLQPVFINPFFNFLQPPVRTGLDLSLRGRRIASKQIAVIHDLIPLKYPSHFPPGIKGSICILLNKLALKNYDIIITDSEASKKDIIKILGIREDKIKIIYPCLPKNFTKVASIKYQVLSTKQKKPLNTKFCLYVGDATWNKNLVNLARAIKIANINCVFVGKIFNKFNNLTIEQLNKDPILNHPWNLELKQFFKETTHDKRFIFPGFVPDSELIKLYEQSLFNILTSRDEGFGFSYVESANFGRPSLLSNIPVLREISDGKAIFFNPADPQNIAKKITKIISDKKLRNKIGVEAKKRSEYFSAEKFKREFFKLI